MLGYKLHAAGRYYQLRGLEPGISALKSVSGGPFLGHLLIWPDAGGGGARRRTDGHWLLVGQRNVIGASRKNVGIYIFNIQKA